MASDLGQAYVQIVPSARGIKGSITGALNGEAGSAGQKAGNSIASRIKGTIITAGIGIALGKSIEEGAKLEQSLGGVETLYKKSAETVKKNAANAWKTAGLSANDYMEQSTMFAASLLQSLGGDTAKAAQYADMALVDMSDNANKFGTNVEDIQHAYQGFSKQNYTMLDNLKLGYGGTKGEMERLLKDASALSGKKYDISNLNDVYDAIHQVQKKLDVTGTTSKEASSTISGSFASMKSSASNLLGNIAIGGDVEGSTKAFVDSAETFLIGNLAPAVGRIITSIPPMIMAAIPALLSSLQSVGAKIIEAIKPGFEKMKPLLITLGIALAPLIVGLGAYAAALGIVKLQGLLYAAQLAIQNGVQIAAAAATNLLATAHAGLNLIMNANPITKVIMVLIALGAAIAVAWKKSETFRAIVGRLWNTVKTAFNFIREKVVSVVQKIGTAMATVKDKLFSPFQKAKEKIKGVIDTVKGFFPLSMGKLFSNIKLPHFNISGGKAPWGIGGKGIKPTIGINWYKTGGVFSGPSVIGVGEAGSEAVVPLDAFWGKMDNMTNSINNNISNIPSQSAININVKLDADLETIAKKTIEYINGQTQRYGVSPLMV
ncbi:hypothetical protein [Anaerofustis stercorihominis]|uniref:Phage tail tape measure protein n=1 Tax=Anaerofustis stercorihominis TaxID=214853 RepID=A0A3E3DUZ6_9FIRM|nr:hypothetical protein [Anaerofustis stercorihominis]RGD72906.1 hypothetical protein DW687_11730 [Anaerofustis stercorihominis]